MPLCFIYTNIKNEDLDPNLTSRLAEVIADATKMPSKYVFVVVNAGLPSCMGDSSEPALLCQVRSMTEFEDEQIKEHFPKFAATLREVTKLPGERIVLELHRIAEGHAALASQV